MADVQVQLAPGTQVAGRYRIESFIAKGGMGGVYVATDSATGTRIALKQRSGVRPREVRMFEREYHTLRSLRHPRIIEVHDYGVADGTAYYTMELLDGQDLRKLAPLPYPRAARYLRDVASSLALLHARRLLHRDLSPGNVRVTSDDRCKLIDFGVLMSFGVAEVLAGTPPFLPPEALSGAPLDQRADLYGLGALAYWLLTGRHAYPAKTIDALRDAWLTPPQPPSRMCRELHPQLQAEPIPAALDALVLTLLDRNPIARPPSAAEVIERLNAAVGLPPDSEPLAAESYLINARTVGREREQKRLLERAAAAIEGVGSSLVIEADPGMGSSRLLAELAVEAQLLGALPVLVDAKLAHGALGAVQELIARLVEASPDLALSRARPHATALAHLAPELGARLGGEADRNLKAPPGELRLRAQSALSDWLSAVSEVRPLVLLIDNAQRLDEVSAALLSALAHDVARHRWMLVLAMRRDEPPIAPAMIKSLSEVSAQMTLEPLDRAHVEELVIGCFGAAHHAARLAERLYRVSAGNPEQCLSLIRQLVQHGHIKHAQGEWLLPRDLDESRLLTSDQSHSRAIGALSPASRQLAQLLALHAAPVALDVCLAIGERAGVGKVFEALDELVENGVVSRSGSNYHFVHDGLRKALSAMLSAGELQRLHRIIGDELAGRCEDDAQAMLDAGFHLLRGGDEGRGADLLATAGVLIGYDSDDMSLAVPPLRAALAVFRKQKRPAYQLARALGPLCNASWYCDFRLAREFGEETIGVLSDLIGLTLAGRLRPWLGSRLSLYCGLGYAALAFTFGRGRKGVRSLREQIVMYCNCVSMLAAVAASCLDAERVKLWADKLEHLAALGRDHAAALTHRFTELLALVPQDEPAAAIRGFRELLVTLEDGKRVRDLPEDSRLMLRGGALYAMGALSSFADSPFALECASALERIGLQLYAMAADQVRASYHAVRGEIELADFYRERVDMHALRAGSGWQAEVWAPASSIVGAITTWDVIALRRAGEELERLAVEIPSLRRFATIARASWLLIRGDAQSALVHYQALIDGTPPRAFVGWSAVLGVYARSLTFVGRPKEAKQVCERALSEQREGDSELTTMYSALISEIARAEVAMGQHEAASARIDTLLKAREHDNPAFIANQHEIAAHAALRAGDALRALHHAMEMERAAEPTANPALLQQCAALRAEIAAFERSTSSPPQGGPSDPDSTSTAASPMALDVSASQQRVEQALQLIVEQAGGLSGYLFAIVRGKSSLLAPLHGPDPPEHLLDQVSRDLRTFQRARRRATTDQAAIHATVITLHEASPAGPPPRAQEYRTVILSRDGEAVDGVVAVLEGPKPRVLNELLARTIAVKLVHGGVLGDARATTPRALDRG